MIATDVACSEVFIKLDFIHVLIFASTCWKLKKTFQDFLTSQSLHINFLRSVQAEENIQWNYKIYSCMPAWLPRILSDLLCAAERRIITCSEQAKKQRELSSRTAIENFPTLLSSSSDTLALRFIVFKLENLELINNNLHSLMKSKHLRSDQ